MNITQYHEVINGENTYKKIAALLNQDNNVIIGWTDGLFNHYDILLVYKVSFIVGALKQCVKEDDLYVNIISIGSYNFNIKDIYSSNYIAATLFHDLDACSVCQLAELINGIIKELHNSSRIEVLNA